MKVPCDSDLSFYRLFTGTKRSVETKSERDLVSHVIFFLFFIINDKSSKTHHCFIGSGHDRPVKNVFCNGLQVSKFVTPLCRLLKHPNRVPGLSFLYVSSRKLNQKTYLTILQNILIHLSEPVFVYCG